MAATNVRSGQLKDGDVKRVDMDITTAGQAVATKIVAGTNVTITYTGVDSGTGDVTINAAVAGGGVSFATVTKFA